jgi:pilus assembly protein CpaC
VTGRSTAIKTRDQRSRRRSLAVTGLAIAGWLAISYAATASEIAVEAGSQSVIVPPSPVRRAAVADPAIADVEIVNPSEVLVIGKHPGATDLALWVDGARQPARYSVTVGAASLGRPSEQSAQVQIDTRIVELSRRGLRQAGINFTRVSNNSAIAVSPPGTLSGISGGGGTGFLLDSASGFLPMSQAFNLVYGNAGENLLVTVSVLEQNGLAHTLAEPSLVALSGQSASFLAGGELPIPVSQSSGNGGNSITIEYKPFGIRLMVTPTVLANDRIALKVAPEVSELDFSSSVDTGGVTVPGLRTRRADTAIELASGESFAISGLVSQQLNSNVDKIPGLGDLPILGAFFKTTRFEREDRELLMIVSPHLVKPLAQGASKLPLPGEEYQNYMPGLYEMQFGETGDFDPDGPGFWP